MKPVLVFDLDDTLYDEQTYVESGFLAVAQFLSSEFGMDFEEVFGLMKQKLAYGRGHIFDDVLRHYGMFSKKAVQKCVFVYRGHKPIIQLDPTAEKCLKRLAQYPLYVVTDGHKFVQKNKLTALGLYENIRFCYRTYQYGIKYSKPSPYCFLQICRRENATPQEIVYIGDNPHKDFVGIKPLGFRTIRLLRGPYQNIRKTVEYEAEYQISSLDELTDQLLQQIFCNN